MCDIKYNLIVPKPDHLFQRDPFTFCQFLFLELRNWSFLFFGFKRQFSCKNNIKSTNLVWMDLAVIAKKQRINQIFQRRIYEHVWKIKCLQMSLQLLFLQTSPLQSLLLYLHSPQHPLKHKKKQKWTKDLSIIIISKSKPVGIFQKSSCLKGPFASWTAKIFSLVSSNNTPPTAIYNQSNHTRYLILKNVNLVGSRGW